MIYFKSRGEKLPIDTGGSSNRNWQNGIQTIQILVDQNYNAASQNAQSGIAVKQAVDQSANNVVKRLGSVLRYKGQVASTTALNALATKEVGDVYDIASGTDAGANYVWSGSAWDKLTESLTSLAKKTDYNTLNNQFAAHKRNEDTNGKHLTQIQLNNVTNATITSKAQIDSIIDRVIKDYINNSTIVDEKYLNTRLASAQTSMTTTVTTNVQNAMKQSFLTQEEFNTYKTQLAKDKEAYIKCNEADVLKIYTKNSKPLAPDLTSRTARTLYMCGVAETA